MKTLEKPVRKWQKQKDYNRHKTIRKIQKRRRYNRQKMAEGKLPKLDDGINPNVFQDAVTGSYYYNDGLGRIDLQPLNKLTEDPATWTYTDASGKVYRPQIGQIDTGSIQQTEEPGTFEKLMRSNKYTEREFDDWRNNKSAIKALYDNFGIMSAPIRALQGGNALLSNDGLSKTYNMFKNSTLDRPDLFWGGTLSGMKDIMDLGLLAEGTYSTNKLFQNRTNRSLTVPQNGNVTTQRSGNVELTEDDFPMMDDFEYSSTNQNQKLIPQKKLLPPPQLSERDKMHLEMQPFMDEAFSGDDLDFFYYYGTTPGGYEFNKNMALNQRILEREYKKEYPEASNIDPLYPWMTQPNENLARHSHNLNLLHNEDAIYNGIPSRMYEEFRMRGLSQREALDEIMNTIVAELDPFYIPDIHAYYERRNNNSTTPNLSSMAQAPTNNTNATVDAINMSNQGYTDRISSAYYFYENTPNGRASALQKANNDFDKLRIGGVWDLTSNNALSTDSYSLQLSIFNNAQKDGLAKIGVVKNDDGTVKTITLNCLGRFDNRPREAIRRINVKIDRLNTNYGLNLPHATYNDKTDTYNVPAINATKLKDGTLIKRIIKSK